MLGLALMVAQAFFYNAIFFTYTLVLGMRSWLFAAFRDLKRPLPTQPV